MSKRSIEQTTTESFSFDILDEQLRKKIKLQNQKIIERVKEIGEDIDINEYEVHKFLLIFHTLFEVVTSEQAVEETGGFLNDTILAIVNVIAGLLKNNIENLNLSTILKTALKNLQSLFIKTETKVSEPNTEIENAKDSVQTEEKASSTSENGAEEQR